MFSSCVAISQKLNLSGDFHKIIVMVDFFVFESCYIKLL